MSTDFGLALRQCRIACAMTQMTLVDILSCKGVNISQSQICRMETGRSSITIDMWIEILTVLGLDPAVVFADVMAGKYN